MARSVPGIAGNILSYFARHRTAANLLLVVLIAAGLAAAPRMRSQFFPDIIIDSVSVSVAWNGAGADDVDLAIVQLLEPALLSVEGVESSFSSSNEGRAFIGLEFEPGWDMSRASDDVQGAVDAVRNLPDAAEEPVVRRGAWRDRVTDVVLTGPVGLDQLGRFADEFVTRLFAGGVTRTSVQGVAASEIIVEISSFSLRRNDFTMSEIAKAIAQEVDANPAGDVGDGLARVRTGVAKRSANDISSIVLRTGLDGSTTNIGDVANIRVKGIGRDLAYYVNDNPAILVRVDRSNQGDAIRIQEKVEEVARELQLSLPASVTMDLIHTRSEAISNRLNLLLENGLMGLGLVVLLLFLFLNARTAFWVAAGIPVAMTGTIAMMYLAGLTFNMISLFALIIVLGIVVDDAIVVGEHADFRVRHLGESPIQAAENAARRMFAPVFSATITTVIAFFGLVVIGGRFGTLIADIPFTVIVVLTASLIECFLILPNHMAHALVHSAKNHWYDWPNRVVNIGFNWFRNVVFRRLIKFVIWARYPAVALAVLILVSQVAIFVRGDIQFRFFNAPEQGSVTGNFAMVNGATRNDSIAMMQELQRATEEVAVKFEAEYGVNPVEYVVAQIGGNSGRGLSGSDTKENWQLGAISIELIDADLRSYSSFAFVAELQDAVQQNPKVETVSFRGHRSGPGGDALDVEFYGADAVILKAAAEALKTALLRFPEVSALEDSLAYDKDELVLALTPQGLALGITVDNLGLILRNRLNGIEAATFPEGARSAAIRVELPTDELTADFLDRTQIRTSSGSYVNLADIVTVETRSGFSTVRRENGVRLVSVNGDISEDDPVRASEIMADLKDNILPKIEGKFGVAFRLAGLAEQEQKFLNDALLGFILCLLGIYLTLAWIFSSWTRPFVVMAIIPFGLVGAIYGHVSWGVPLSMFSIVGLIGMTGIIINDSIVLVTTIDEHTKNRGVVPAIIDGTADRLRPVMLTTATTVLGLTPLLFETSQDAQFLKPTVITLVYGLGFGMFLVLLMVPAVMAMQQDLGRQLRATRRAFSMPGRGKFVSYPSLLVALVGLAIFGVTIGAKVATGRIWDKLPLFAPDVGMPFVFALFVLGISAIALLAFLAGALGSFRRQRP